MRERELEGCCVADQFCEAAEDHEPKARCFSCGQRCCVKCSSRRRYYGYGIKRICNDCQIEYDGDDKRVKARLHKLAGY